MAADHVSEQQSYVSDGSTCARAVSQSAPNWVASNDQNVFSVLEDRSLKSRCPQGHASSDTCGGESSFLLASGICWQNFKFLNLKIDPLSSLSPSSHGLLLPLCICVFTWSSSIILNTTLKQADDFL